MSAAEIDRYLKSVPARQRAALEQLRTTILKVAPEAEQCISYRVPAFRVAGGVVCGFASFKNHMSYLPFSGSVLDQLANEVDAYSHSKSALRFTVTTPLTDELVEQLIRVRLSEIHTRKR
ncbi:MAG: iron chaperone [Acidimicrobiales bacterium]